MSTQAYVSTGKPAIGGAIYRAPAGTALPTDATTALSNDFKNLGYVSEDGLVNTNTASTEQLKAWGGDIVAQPQTEKPDTFAATFIEAVNEDVLKATYGDDNVSGTLATGIAIAANANAQEEMVFVADLAFNEGVLKRIVLPKAAVTAVGDITYQTSGAVGYQTTITAFPDSSGNTHYEYIISPSS